MDKAERRGFPWGLTVATLAVLGVLIALGSWQARRLVWKEGLIATATAAAQRPAAPLAQVLAESGDAEFRAVTVDWVTFNRSDARTSDPVSTMARNVLSATMCICPP